VLGGVYTIPVEIVTVQALVLELGEEVPGEGEVVMGEEVGTQGGYLVEEMSPEVAHPGDAEGGCRVYLF